MKLQVTGEQPADGVTVTGGQQSAVIEVNAGAVFAVNGQTGNVTIGGVTDWINVMLPPYGAAGDGLHDDTAALQGAINACQPGGTVYLPRGVYKTTATLDLKNGVTLRGSHAHLMVGPGMTGDEYPSYIQPAGEFTGTSVIQIIGDADGSHPNISGEQRLIDLMLDGSKLGGSSVDGLFARGNVQNVVMDNVCIRQMPNNGIVTASRGDGTFPYSWRLHHVMVDNCHANGILFTGNTDITLDDVQVIGCWAQGFVLTNCTNAQLIACRAEWMGSHGFHITGAWGDWQGSGGMQMTGCSTDRNGQHGILVDATGNTPILISGLMTRRDGRNGGAGGGGYAGLAVIGATAPVTLDGIQCYPGVDDTGSTTNSPQYGARLSGASTVTLDNAFLHANTAGLYDDGTNTLVSLGGNIVTAAGATTVTARALRPRILDWVNVQQRGAKGDGTSDDTAVIQAALTACPAGGVVYLPAGVYRTSAPLKVPPYVTLRGSHGGGEAQSTSAPTPACIKPLPSFTGDAVIDVLDQQLGGYSTIASEVRIEGVTIVGSAIPSGTPVDGILATGQIQMLSLRDVQVRSVTGKGINTAYNPSAPPGPQAPFCLHFERVSVLWAASHGVVLNNSTDSTFQDVYVLGCSGFGWYISGADNSMWVACRAEWSGLDGFNLAGGKGVQAFIGCATDRNGQNGISVPSTTDTGTILLSGCHLKRDGKNSTTAGYAGLKVASSSRKVVADNLITTTGANDDGSGNTTPQYGVSATSSAYVTVASGVLTAVSAGWNDGGGNTTFLRGPMVTGSNITSWLWPGTAATVAAAAASIILQAMVGGDTAQRLTVGADGKLNWGPGNAATDTTAGRAASGVWYTSKNALIGSATALGDNGVGEIQLADAATAPTTNPTGGSAIYSQSAAAVPLRMRDVSGNVRGLVSAEVIAAAAQNNSTTTQAASTSLTIPVEASATYRMTGMLVIQSPSGVSFTHSFTGPSGATMTWGDTTATYIASLTGVDTWSGTGANRAANIAGTLVTSTTAGNLVVTFASGTAGQTATLGQNSWLRLERIK
ncbi:glycosyl hydrolase family 28-related protein [Streptomyces mirabilis]|uniref:glycosyl hydrolase family 28-related protein n=1 Tax=Streptomyces mirabilis TaxID=68239 RepID=UPI003325F799